MGPNQQDRALRKVPEEITYTCLWATNKTIHSSSFPLAQKEYLPLVTQSLVGGGRDEIGSKVMTHRSLSDTANLPL